MHSRGCLPPTTPAMRALTDLYARRQLGQAPHRAALRRSAPPHSDAGKATKSNTTLQYERPGTAGSSSRRHRRTGIRGPAPAERRVNRTQALRSALATRLTTGHADRARTRFCALPAQRGAARCHDQHKLTQPARDRRSPQGAPAGTETPGQKHKLCSRDRTRTYNLPVNRRSVIAGDRGCLRCCQPV
jgi:hypothetical protein